MSVDAGLRLHLSGYRIMDIVECYRKCGLDVFNFMGGAHIGISDDDDFDWECLSVTYDELKSVIESRERNGLPIGIALFENGAAVTSLLKTQSDELVISCDINRKTFAENGVKHTDVNYCISKFVVPLEENGFAVAGFDFWEYR